MGYFYFGNKYRLISTSEWVVHSSCPAIKFTMWHTCANMHPQYYKPQSKWQSDGGAVGRYAIHGSSSCASVCVLYRHLTHRLPLFSLGRLVFRVTHAGWELCGTTRVLLHCLPPGHVSLCVCMCFCMCVRIWARQNMITTLKWHKETNTRHSLLYVKWRNLESHVGSI